MALSPCHLIKSPTPWRDWLISFSPSSRNRRMTDTPYRCLILSDFNADTLAGYLSNDEDWPAIDAVTAPFGQVLPLLLDGEREEWQGQDLRVGVDATAGRDRVLPAGAGRGACLDGCLAERGGCLLPGAARFAGTNLLCPRPHLAAAHLPSRPGHARPQERARAGPPVGAHEREVGGKPGRERRTSTSSMPSAGPRPPESRPSAPSCGI